MEQDQNQQSDLFGMELDNEAKYSFIETAKWARFLTIVTIVGLGLLLFFCLIFGKTIANNLAAFFPGDKSEMSFALILALLIVIAVCGMLLYFLFKASTNIRTGITANNQQIFNEGLNALRIFFVIYGVLAILGLLSSILKTF